MFVREREREKTYATNYFGGSRLKTLRKGILLFELINLGSYVKMFSKHLVKR